MSSASSNIHASKPSFVKLQLRTAYGPVYRDVSTNPPRDARPDEIPLIDFSRIKGDLQERKQLAQEIKKAAETLGFFYAVNHGISEEVIEAARDAAQAFFKQSQEEKLQVSKSKSKFYNGYSARGTGKASPSEGSMPNILSVVAC